MRITGVAEGSMRDSVWSKEERDNLTPDTYVSRMGLAYWAAHPYDRWDFSIPNCSDFWAKLEEEKKLNWVGGMST